MRTGGSARRGRGLVLFLALLAACVASPAWAGSTTGTVRGVVLDRDGNPLPGVTVTLENPSRAVTGLGGVTNEKGEFRIAPVPAGQGYVLRASLPSYQKIEFGDIEVTSGETVVQSITLRPALTERIKVEGKGDVVKTESTVTSTTISSEFLSGLPILGRDYQDILTLAPGVTDVNNTGNPNIHGARDTDVVTLVDGVSTTDPFTGQFGQQLNIESIEQIEVITAGATAEYSRAQGGFVNIITKSGGNEFKGTFKYFMRTQRLDGDGAGIDPGELRGGLGEADGFRNMKFSDLYPFLSLSGAFVKDRLWYYFAPEYSQIEDPINAGTHAYVARTVSTRATAKTTWQATSNDKLALIVLYDDTVRSNLGLDSRIALESGYKDTRGGPTLTLTDTAIVSPTLAFESTLSRFDQSFSVRPTLNPDTNHNGILTVDDRPDLGGNNDGFVNLGEYGDPGQDLDRDGRWDVFEDFNHNRSLDGCHPVLNPVTGVEEMVCYGCGTVIDPATQQPKTVCGEDRDRDGKITAPNACEGELREDVNCDGLLNFESDFNQNGKADPDEDTGLPCSNPVLCPNGYVPGTKGNGRFDTEDKDGNGVLSTLPHSLDSPFPFWNDRNHDGVPEIGEFVSPIPGDRNYVLDQETNRISGPFFREYGDSRTRDTLKEDVSYYVDDLFGSHDIKMGAIFEREGFDRETIRRPFVQLDTGSINLVTGRIGGTMSAFLPTVNKVRNQAGSDNVGFYAQDTYKPLPNLTVGLGLRFDREAVSSHGYTFFDPARERLEFDTLINLMDVEAVDDLNADGIQTYGLNHDPLYMSPANNRIAELDQALGQAAPTRFTRHNFSKTKIESAILSQNLGSNGTDLLAALSLGRRRTPQDFTLTNNNLAPRLSVAWDPWADGKSKTFAQWGRFYDKLFLATVVGEEGPDFLSPLYVYDSDGVNPSGIPDNRVGAVISKSPPSAYQVDRGMKTPYTDELTLGFEREIAPEVSVSFTYIRRKFREQLQDIDVNHTTRRDGSTFHCTDKTPDGYCDLFGVTIVPDNPKGLFERTGDKKPDLYINNYNFNQIFRVGNYNVQDYTGYELQFTRRLSRKWQMDASYVFSQATGQAESFLSESGDDPALTELRHGYLDYDQRHVARFHAISYLPGDWQLGWGLQWSSGLPYSRISRFASEDNVEFVQTRRLFGSKDLNTGQFVPEFRNNRRNHSVYDINARAAKNFVIGQVAAGAFFEIFNLLNTDDLRIFEIDNSFKSLQADETRRFGRRFQFGIQLDF